MNTSDLNLDEIVDLLGRTPATLDALLGGTTGFWHSVAEGEGTWSAFDVVGHLIHGEETDWVPRARMILDRLADHAFEPFDRFAQFDRFKDTTMDDLLKQFRKCRRENLQVLTSWRLREEQMGLRGTHPEFGPVTLGQLLATWAVHDLGHIAQVARVMTGSLAEKVGPWKTYLRIVQSRADST